MVLELVGRLNGDGPLRETKIEQAVALMARPEALSWCKAE